jgi:hypothetical protein
MVIAEAAIVDRFQLKSMIVFLKICICQDLAIQRLAILGELSCESAAIGGNYSNSNWCLEVPVQQFLEQVPKDLRKFLFDLHSAPLGPGTRHALEDQRYFLPV